MCIGVCNYTQVTDKQITFGTLLPTYSDFLAEKTTSSSPLPDVSGVTIGLGGDSPYPTLKDFEWEIRRIAVTKDAENRLFEIPVSKLDTSKTIKIPLCPRWIDDQGHTVIVDRWSNDLIAYILLWQSRYYITLEDRPETTKYPAPTLVSEFAKKEDGSLGRHLYNMKVEGPSRIISEFITTERNRKNLIETMEQAELEVKFRQATADEGSKANIFFIKMDSPKSRFMGSTLATFTPFVGLRVYGL